MYLYTAQLCLYVIEKLVIVSYLLASFKFIIETCYDFSSTVDITRKFFCQIMHMILGTLLPVLVLNKNERCWWVRFYAEKRSFQSRVGFHTNARFAYLTPPSPLAPLFSLLTGANYLKYIVLL